MTTLYWQVFKNIEREFLQLADIIHIDDKQLGVYSMKIADLLIRTAIEIEAISKDLYLSNAGVVVPDEEMYFDTVCIRHLDSLWNLDKKVVYIVNPNLFLEQETNKILTPLHKASKRGTSSVLWNRAYQAVKHNRIKELEKGNIKNLLSALSALYILNLYYKNPKIDKVSQEQARNVDSNFGSELFAVKTHFPNGLSSDGTYPKKADYDECIYIFDYEAESKKNAIDAIKSVNDYSNTQTQKILVEKIEERISKGLPVTEEWINEERINTIKLIYPIKDAQVQKKLGALGKLMYNLELNKNQY